jgi:hypothetical protein
MNTAVFKIIENQNGIGFVKHQIVNPAAGKPNQPQADS